MDIDLLKTFIEVNKTHHFGRAAENLYLSQSAISARIRQLEENVGAPLFTRNRNDIRLTAIGEKLLPHAENIVTAWNRARQEATLGNNIEESLIIGGSPSLWDIVLQDWLHRIYRSMPDLAVTAEVDSRDVLFRKLLDGTLDLALAFEGPQIVRLNVVELPTVQLVMVSNQKHTGVDQALKSNYILVDWGTSFLTKHARLFKDWPVPRLRLGLGRMAREFVLSEGGVAYLAELTVEQDLKNRKLFRVPGAPVIDRPVFAVFPEAGEKAEVIHSALSLLG